MKRDPLLRTAFRLVALLNPRAEDLYSRDVSTLLDGLHAVERLDGFRSLADAKGWSLAARRVKDNLLREVRAVHERSRRLLGRGDRSPPEPPPLRCLVEDLRQLTEEFEQVEFDLKGRRIIAVTCAIELEGIALGRFAIELHLPRLSSRKDASCFDCVALQPNPASNNSSVTHPHVQDRQLCAGDASAPIAAALEQGRICDAFCLIRGVLQTYNAASGRSCHRMPWS